MPNRQHRICSNTVTSINGFKARNIKGFFWLWTNLFSIIKSVKKAHGCFECISCIVSPVRVVMISYRTNLDELTAYFKSSNHKKLMNFFYINPKSLALFTSNYGIIMINASIIKTKKLTQ